MKRAVIIMAKVPRAGKVKTRLQPRLSPAQSADFAAHLLKDTIEKAKSLGHRLIIAFAPAEESAFFDKYSTGEFILTEQKGSDLGEKMFNAFKFAFDGAVDSAVLIGTDSPTFPAEFIERAFADLKTADAVLGKTSDGGFYLIGLKLLKKEIFENVEWSSEKTYGQTRRNIHRLNLTLKNAPDWYDVDEPADLNRLRKDFALNEISRLTAPNTFKWLETIA